MAEPRRKRVAIFLPNLGGGGAERVALASANDLSRRGHDVDLVLVESSGELLPLVPEGVRVVDLKAPRIIAALPLLLRYLREERPDTLHVAMWPLTIVGIVAHKLAKSRARLVVSDQVALSRQVTGGPRRRLLEWSTRIFYPLADVRIACSQAAADDLACLSGLTRDRIEVVYNPISPPKRVTSTAAVERLWPGQGPRIISIGALKEQKNQALLLDAFARLANDNASLMILGEGPLRPLLHHRAAELGIADRIVLPGFAVDPWPYLASADLFVLSSDYEGFPLVLGEAMHAGLKIVSTDCVSGPAEMLDGGRYGRLVPCGDADALGRAIDEAVDAPPDPDRMRARAIEMAGPAMIRRYSELLTA